MEFRTSVLAIFLFSGLTLQAQVVTENVSFDFYQDAVNNDFVNHFDNGYGMTQIQTNGITGGCVTTPDSISWGNDNAVYCSRYKPLTGDTILTSVCFKYDSAGVNPSGFQRAMSIWLVPYSDFNHYIISTVSYNKKLEMLTYSWNNNPYPLLNLQHNHWYRYSLRVIFTSNTQLNLKAEVFDLGTSGLDIPSLVNSSTGNITDNVLASDTSIQVSITGTTYGGAVYLDDFSFQGRLGSTTCINIPTAIHNADASPAISIYPMPASDEVTIELEEVPSEEIRATVYKVTGDKIFSMILTEKVNRVDVQSLPAGMYYLNYTGAYKTVVLPLLICR